MPLTTLDANTALIVIDLQKGIINSPFVHPISGVIERTCALLEAFRQHDLRSSWSMSPEAHRGGRSSRAVTRRFPKDSAI